MSSYDVVIIGAGIIGGSIAFELSRRRLRVAVLDRQQPGREASWAAAGMLAPAPEAPDAVGIVPLGRASFQLYPEFVAAVEAASGQKVGYRPDGALAVFFPPDAEAARNRMVELHRKLGLAAEALSVEEAQLFEPSLNPSAGAAERLPEEASVDTRALTEAVLAAAARGGVEVRAGAEVTSLVIEKGRCTAVAAGNERIRAGHVVVAAGCHSAGIEPLRGYAPTVPVRGQMAALRSEKVRIGRALRGERGYVVPRNDGRIIAGSTLENAGFEKNLTAGGLAHILAAAIELLPGLAEAAMVETWCGLRPDTPDHLPVLGPTEIEGLSIATGHYRNGMLLAPITAKLAGEWVSGKNTSLPLDAFSPMRFLRQQKKYVQPASV